MLSNQNEKYRSCFIGVDDYDVTNIQEASVFLTLFFIYAALIYQTIQNLIKLAIMQRQPNQCEKSLTRIKQMNIMIILNASIELIQKLEQLIFYTIMQYNGRDMETLILSTKIYDILFEFKLSSYYILIIQNAYLWYSAIKPNSLSNITQNIYKFLSRYFIPGIIITISVFNTVTYLLCAQQRTRNINYVSTTFITMAIFFFSIWRANKYFDKSSSIPNLFKQKIRRSSYLLYFSIPFKITYFMLLWLNEDLVVDFKQYNFPDMIDDGYHWFVFLIIYQILVGFFPLWYLSILFTPKQNNRFTRVQNQESTQIHNQSLLFS